MSKSKTLVAALVLGLLPVVAGAQALPAVGALSEQDRADIRDLVARYARALGSCAAEEYAALFTSDATFTSDDFRGKKHREMYGKAATLKGRDQLVELVRTEEFCMEGRPRNTGGNRAAPQVQIEPSPEGALGSAPIGADGRYDDIYVKTAEGWRFKSRTVTMPSVSPPDVRGGFGPLVHHERRRQAALHGHRPRPGNGVRPGMDDGR